MADLEENFEGCQKLKYIYKSFLKNYHNLLVDLVVILCLNFNKDEGSNVGNNTFFEKLI